MKICSFSSISKRVRLRSYTEILTQVSPPRSSNTYRQEDEGKRSVKKSFQIPSIFCPAFCKLWLFSVWKIWKLFLNLKFSFGGKEQFNFPSIEFGFNNCIFPIESRRNGWKIV